MNEIVKKGRSLLPARRTKDVVGGIVGAFESETAAVVLETSPRHQRILIYVMALGFVLSIAMAALIKLERVVVSVGRIVPLTGFLYISPFDNGIVRDIRVKPGDIVHKGEVLATLDSTFTAADRDQLTLKLASDEAAVQRLEAELAGKPYVVKDSEPSHVLQRSIWNKRQAEYRSNLMDFDAKLKSAQAQISQFETDLQQYSKRRKLAADLEALYGPLLDKGYVSQLQMMQTTDTVAEVSRLQSDAEHQLASARQTLQSVKAQREAFVQRWSSDTGSELVIRRNEAEVTQQSLQKASRLNELVTLNAPADVIVLKIGKASRGSIAGSGANPGGAGEPLFTLVPLDAALEADVKVAAHDIGFIKAGDPVDIKFDAYQFMQHGTAKGRIKTISEGSFTIDDNGGPMAPYFAVRVTVTDAKLRNVPKDFRLIPGMTVQGDMLVGKRSILSYLVEGVVRTGSEAMREPF